MDLDKVLQASEVGEWHEMEAGEDPNPRFKIKTLKPSRISQIRRTCMRKKNLRYPEGIDDEKLYHMVTHECIADWENISQNGGEFEYSDTNLKFISDNWMAFRRWWNLFFQRMLVDGQIEEDDELGN